MPNLPRDIGEQIAGARSKRSRLLDMIRRLLGLPPRADTQRPPPRQD